MDHANESQAAEPLAAMDGVELFDRGDVAGIRLNRPPVNAVGAPMLRALARTAAGIPETAPEARAVVLEAEGPHFCAGADRRGTRVGFAVDDLIPAAEDLQTLLEAPLPAVGALHGAAVGTGMLIAATCDILVIADDAEVWLPEVELGLLGGAGYAHRLLPPPIVRRMVLLGEHLESGQLLALGAGVPGGTPEQTRTRAWELATQLADRPPPALRAARAVLGTLDVAAADVHRHEMRSVVDLLGDPNR